MIPKSTVSVIPISIKSIARPQKGWKQELTNLIRDPDILMDRLGLTDPQLKHAARQASKLFPLRLTESYLSRIETGNPDDPLLRQVLPLGAEYIKTPNFSADPTHDKHASKGPGLLHKYHGRVLLIATAACAIHCRYCFRREFPYAESTAKRQHWQQTANYIRQNTDIHEVILSGGDPLMLDDDKLAELIQLLETLPHLQRLRIHSRLPVVLPSRITASLGQLLMNTRLQCIMVIHSNHSKELNNEVATALQQLKQANVSLFNQSVLLAGINDDSATQIALAEHLFTLGVIPYYLHILDQVNGSAHFEVSAQKAASIYHVMHQQLPGYMLPRMVKEIPGQPGKTPVEQLQILKSIDKLSE